MKEKCIIIGAGTYGQVYSEYLKESYDVIGFIDDNFDFIDLEINNIRVLGDFEYLIKKVSNNINVFVPLGDNIIRKSYISILTEHGFNLPNFIHPSVIIPKSAKIGECVYILGGTKIMPFVEIMDYVMISMGVNIAHHTIISKGCFISEGANIGASIILGEYGFFGIGSIVITGINRIGDNVVIGGKRRHRRTQKKHYNKKPSINIKGIVKVYSTKNITRKRLKLHKKRR